MGTNTSPAANLAAVTKPFHLHINTVRGFITTWPSSTTIPNAKMNENKTADMVKQKQCKTLYAGP
jgi:hypothetical protein